MTKFRNRRALRTLGSCPAANLACEVDANDLGALELPWNVGHDVDSVGTTNTTCNHAETTSVGGVRVGTNHKSTGEGIVLQDDLVNDTRARPPETETVLKPTR